MTQQREGQAIEPRPRHWQTVIGIDPGPDPVTDQADPVKVEDDWRILLIIEGCEGSPEDDQLKLLLLLKKAQLLTEGPGPIIEPIEPVLLLVIVMTAQWTIGEGWPRMTQYWPMDEAKKDHYWQWQYWQLLLTANQLLKDGQTDRQVIDPGPDWPSPGQWPDGRDEPRRWQAAQCGRTRTGSWPSPIGRITQWANPASDYWW